MFCAWLTVSEQQKKHKGIQLQIAYLLNSYPMTSTTFVRREIEAIERQGRSVKRYAIRHWDGELVDPADIAEQERTEYLLKGNAIGLVIAFLREIVTNPTGLFKAVGPWFSLLKNARGGFIRHSAYFLEAVYFRQRAASADIGHVHVHFITNATAVAMLARIMGGPSYSIMVHGPDELTDAPLLSFPAKIEHASFVAAITHFCKSQLIRFSKIEYAEKIEIVHCGLELGEFKAENPVSEDNQVFVCVGRLCPQKGQSQIPAAAAALREEFPGLKILLVGDGESRGEVEAAIARHSVGDMIDITGWMENEKVRACIAANRALLLPSYAEGLPVVIMEALALGKPVITTYIAGIPELVDDQCGWIIPAGSHEHLVEAMRAALKASPAELAEKGAVGRARIETAHNVDHEADKLVNIIDQRA